MSQILRDVRYAGRVMAKSPAVTAIAMASLAVALAANVTIFSLVNALFFKALPLSKPEEVVVVFGTDAKQAQVGGGNFLPISRPNYLDYRDRNEVFTGLANMAFAGVNLVRGDAEAVQVPAQLVSANFFEVLGVGPGLGRYFQPSEDEVPGRDLVAVLSYRAFETRFGADPAVVGSTVHLNSHAFTIIGVAPKGFEGAVVLAGPELWLPMMTYELILPSNIAQHYKSRRALMTFNMARLKPGVSVAAAEASLATIAQALEREYPQENTGRGVGLLPLNEARVPPQLRRNFELASGLLMGVVGLVLLIACANVANLLLNRALGRRSEIALRLSMGAPRGRLIQQLLVESLLLGLGAMALGLLMAWWAKGAILALSPPFVNLAQLDTSFDVRVLLFTLVASLGTALLFGLVPALGATRPEVVSSLKLGVGMASGRPRLWSLRHLLVAGQVALSLVALVASALFLKSLGNATAIDLGFDGDKVGVVPLNATAAGYDPARAAELFATIEQRVAALPGVESVALGQDIPLLQGGFARTTFVDGRDPKAENNGLLTPVDPIGEGYFRTLGIPLLSGRDFSSADNLQASFVAIFNQAAVRRFFGNEPALGQRIRFFDQNWVLEIVGVVADSKLGVVGEEPQPLIYLPRRQHPAAVQSLFVRASQQPERVLAQARDQVRAIERNLPLANVVLLAEGARQTLWPARVAAGLLGIFGALALALALAGIYGVMSYAVALRRREIGIRLALGSPANVVVGQLVRRGMVLVAAGLVVGLALTLAAGRGLVHLLYGLSPGDPSTLAVTTLLLALVACLATFLPARRAAAVDPVTVLKGEG